MASRRYRAEHRERGGAMEEEAGSGEVGDDELMILDSVVEGEEQSKARLRVRTDLRDQLNDTKRNAAELVTCDVEVLYQRLQDCNNLFKDVTKPPEAALDAKLVTSIADIGEEKSRVLVSDANNFSTTEFARRLSRAVKHGTIDGTNESDDQEMSVADWARLGRSCQIYLKQTPHISYMCGAFARNALVTQAARTSKPRPEKDDNANVVSTAPEQLTSLDDVPGKQKETTMLEVERIYQLLHDWYHRFLQPLCFFEFVVNPASFEQTVENIFYTSFLIQDGLAKLCLDVDKLPVIMPMEGPRQAADGGLTQNLNQTLLVSMTRQKWREVVDVFHVTRCIIPTRPIFPHPSINRRLASSLHHRQSFADTQGIDDSGIDKCQGIDDSGISLESSSELGLESGSESVVNLASPSELGLEFRMKSLSIRLTRCDEPQLGCSERSN